jgi:hypothetical protein
MVQSRSFLADEPFLEPVKKRILADIEKEPLLRVGASYVGGGFFLGRWFCDPGEARFSHFAKSADRTELFVVRGQFILGRGEQWVARITEASRTHLFNLFGKKEYEQIQPGMTMNDVIKILGAPPMACFAGEAVVDIPAGNRYVPFSGTSKECEESYRPLSARDAASGKRAWISNDIAIYIGFDENGKVDRKESLEVREPHERSPAASKAIEELLNKVRKHLPQP